jgi:apolipoprotein N-acyltransferase
MARASGTRAESAARWTRRLGGWRGDLVVALGGLALPFAFSPFFLWPLAVVSVGSLFVTCVFESPRRAAWRGWLHGVASYGAGVWWIVSSFQFSNIALPVALLLTAGFVGFLALYSLLVAVVANTLSRRVPLAAGLLAVFPAVFMLAEWLRGWALSGFTWLQLGYSQVDGPLVGLLPLGGVYAAGLAVSLAGGGLTLLIVAPERRSALALAGIVVVTGGLSVVGSRDWTAPSGQPLTIALVQGNVPQEQKWRPEMRVPTLQRYMSLTQARPETDLVIWPETALPGQRRAMAPFIERLSTLAREAGMTVLFGVPEWDGMPLRAYNSVYMTGVHEGRYRKRHLVPFGEFLPLDTVLRPLTRALGIPVANFQPGARRQQPLRVAGHELAVFICYEIAFGNEVVRALPGAGLLVTVSNDAWFGDSMGPHQHLQMARARALETGRELVRATNTGITVSVDVRGQVRDRLPQFQTGALDVVAQPRSGTTPYVTLGDWPALIIALGLLAVCGWRGRRRTG